MKYLIFLLLFISCYQEELTPDVPTDQECMIASMYVKEESASFDIYSSDAFVTITRPYMGGLLTYTVCMEQYDCIGFFRLSDPFTITISDGGNTCDFIVPEI